MSDAGSPIYLDHNATTPMLPAAREAMLPFLGENFGNPSSSHRFGRRARQAVDRARGQVAALLGCSASEIVFTSGGTEANNLAIVGVARARPSRRTLVSSVIEHPATARPCQWLASQGHRLRVLDVDHQGRVVVDQARQAIDEDTALNVRFPKVTGDAVLAHAPEVAASTGSACHAEGPSASATILAMGVSRDQALGSLRLSLGKTTTEAEIEAAAKALIAAYKKATAETSAMPR